MNHDLSRRLARIIVEEMAEIAHSRVLAEWLEDNAIGHVANRRIHISESDRARIARLLEARGVDPYSLIAAPAEMTRSGAFEIAIDEKAGAAPIGRGRSLVRAMPGRTLRIGNGLLLPEGASLDVPNSTVVENCGHDSVLLVENRECFDLMERVTFRHEAFDADPLVIFRGSPRVSAGSMALIAELSLPVDVFGDIDPEGLAIAGRIPHARSFVHPSVDSMTALIETKPNHERFRKQIAGASGARGDHPAWLDVPWSFVTRHACALPQEAFLRSV
jgi:hypothetical protein